MLVELSGDVESVTTGRQTMLVQCVSKLNWLHIQQSINQSIYNEHRGMWHAVLAPI